MSYCRANQVTSDVYVIHNAAINRLMCFCAYEEAGDEWSAYRTNSRLEMIDHLYGHFTEGEKVPTKALTRLAQEIVEVGDKIDNNA